MHVDKGVLPPPWRLGAGLAERLAAAWRTLIRWNVQRRNNAAAVARCERLVDSLAALDASVLLDIGAPEPLLARALARRDTAKSGMAATERMRW